MKDNFVFGQFYSGNSLLHQMDPRAKLICGLLLMTGVLLAGGRLAMAVNALILLLLFFLVKLPPEAYFRALRPFAYIMAATFALQIFLTPGEALVSLGPLALSREGWQAGVQFLVRLVFLLLISLFLTATTSSLALAKGLESLLRPLGRLGFPAQETALMMAVALRFIPTLLEEGEKIKKAQEARGIVWGRGSARKRMVSLAALVIPLLLKVFRRADELALAMEARCYGGGITRTSLEEQGMAPRDYLAMALCGGVLVMMAVWR